MNNKTCIRESKRYARHRRIRKKVIGTEERPRLCVHRSLKNFYAQIVNDTTGKVLWGISTLNKEIQTKLKNGGNREAASLLGKKVAEEALSQGIKKVCFDRGGYYYHGRVKAFAEAARKNGMVF